MESQSAIERSKLVIHIATWTYHKISMLSNMLDK